MPNHIKNRIEITGDLDQIDSLIKRFGTDIPAKLSKTHDDELIICKHKTDQYDFMWFNMLTGESHNRGKEKNTGLPSEYEPEITQGFFAFPDFKKVIPPPDDPAYSDQPNQQIAKTSPNWWYNWNCDNWGTKWGGYSYVREGINIFQFQTAWSGVPKIIEVISKAFPDLQMIYTWADEDSGSNCGTQTYHSGVVVFQNIPKSQSKEAYDIYFSLNPEDKAQYNLVGDTYEYIEQD
jgi:hypothetical protein